ncbi:MAG TPA: hypothetical protein VFK54_02360 [Candidatus Limnocylindrales bacterium]|nr:hypothetical protein [Candidatus Limnocylindrales bacterium]
MNDTRSTRIGGRLARLAVLALTLVVAACGGAPGGGSPTAVVQTALDRMAAKQLDQLPELACAAERDRITEQFDLTGGMGAFMPGLDTAALIDAVSFDVSKVVLAEGTVSGDSAEVQMTGSIGIAFDDAKMREVLRPVLEQQGLPADDASLDAMLSGLEGMAQAVPLNETVQVVREDGAWKICDSDFGG